MVMLSDGRDKLCKVIQYGSRVLMAQSKASNKESYLMYKTLFKNFRDSRKIFRLLKFVNEIQTIMKSIGKNEDGDPVDQVIFVASRVGFMLYWLFDNLLILSKLKVLKSNSQTFMKPSMFFWWLGVTFTLARTLRRLQQLKDTLLILNDLSQKAPERKSEIDSNIKQTLGKMTTCFLIIIKMFGDIIPSGAGWGLYDSMGFNVGDTEIGLGGLLSALVSVIEIYRRK